MSKTIYTAGAMQIHVGNHQANVWREKAKEYFHNVDGDFKIINPTDYYQYGENAHKTEKEIMRFDLRMVEYADVILADLNDIRKSLGTSDEVLHAYKLGKPVIGFVNQEFDSVEELRTYVHPWKYEQCDRIETGKGSLNRALEYIRNYYQW